MKDADTLYYVHDPMCSWCYAFRPVWAQMRQQLPQSVNLQYVVGGLARDSSDPMPEIMQQKIRGAWQRIETAVPGTRFNFDFWERCKPRRSTYPSCRAVILAREASPKLESAMIEAIQNAYYQQAKNPSDIETLSNLAEQIGLDTAKFSSDLVSAATEEKLQQELQLARSIGGNSFPSLILKAGAQLHDIALNYNDSAPMLETLRGISAKG